MRGAIAALSLATRTFLSFQQHFRVSLRPVLGCVAYGGSLSGQLGKMPIEIQLKYECLTHSCVFLLQEVSWPPPTNSSAPFSPPASAHWSCCSSYCSSSSTSTTRSDSLLCSKGCPASADSHRQGAFSLEAPGNCLPHLHCLPSSPMSFLHRTCSVHTSPALLPQSCSPEVNVTISWSQRCSFCAVSCRWFRSDRLNPQSELQRGKQKSGLQLAATSYSPPCFMQRCLYGGTG